MNKVDINNIFSIGYRCITDEFLIKLKIRKYSSPFSYMVIDYETCFHFINNNFKNFLTDIVDCKKNGYYTWKCGVNEPGGWANASSLFIHNINKRYFKIKDFMEWDKICLWNHHNLYVEKNNIEKRCNRFLKILNTTPEMLLLLCIDKVKDYNDTKTYYDIDILNEFVKKYNCHLLFLIPLYNYNKDPEIVVNIDKIKIIYFNSYYENNGTGLCDKRIKWDFLEKMILDIYNFNIKEKD